MVVATSSVKGVLADFPTPIFPKIDGELTGEVLLDIHQFVSGNAASVASNLGGGQYGHPLLTITAEEYRS